MVATTERARSSAPRTHFFNEEGFNYGKCPGDLRLPSERGKFPTSQIYFDDMTYDNDAREVN